MYISRYLNFCGGKFEHCIIINQGFIILTKLKLIKWPSKCNIMQSGRRHNVRELWKFSKKTLFFVSRFVSKVNMSHVIYHVHKS